MPTIELLFDLTKAYAGLNGLGGILDRKLPKSAANFEKNFGKTMGRAAGFAFAKFNLIFGAIKKVISTVGKQFPEIGQTMAFAGKVISKNLLWPLRQELLPMLNKFLKWVTANREQFVKWGRVIANIFKMFIAGIQNIIKPFQMAFAKIRQWMKDTFKMDNIADGFNILLHKIVAIFSVIQGVITNVFGWLLENVIEPFFSGFMKGVSNLKDSLGALFSSFGKLGAEIDKLFGKSNALKTVFGTLGSTLAASLTTGVEALKYVIDRISDAVFMVGNFIDFAKEWKASDFTTAFGNFKTRTVQRFEESITGIKEQGGRLKGAWGSGSGTHIEHIAGAIQGRAEGGPVSAGQPYIVGEKRPELFVPRQDGNIIPDLSSLGNKTVSNVFHINVVANDSASAGQQVVNELKRYATLMGKPGVFA